MRVDCIILGGGVVGTSLALALSLRGRQVALIDKGRPGGGTSFGNAGLIQKEAVMPYPFPRDPMLLLQYAFNMKAEANFHLSDFLKVAPFLWRYFRMSDRDGQLATARANAPLFALCLSEHQELARAAGAEAMLRPGGWLKVFRKDETFEKERTKALVDLAPFGIKANILDTKGVQALEPNLSDVVIGGIHWPEPLSLNDPEALTLAHARQVEALGGKVLVGNAFSLLETTAGWSVTTEAGTLEAPDCVVALGPWAPDLLEPMGYSVPMGIKRGYHVHMRPKGNARLGIPVLDADIGYAMAPMAKGIRLTSGAEFAGRDARSTPVQLDRLEPHARALFPLDSRIEETPWLGSRPCMPDMRPVMGRAGKHRGLWFNFGHAHHGLTLAGSCARLMAEMMTGEAPFTDPAPYALERFG